MDCLNTTSPLSMAGSGQSFMEIFERAGLTSSIKNKTELLNVFNYISFMSQVTIAALTQFKEHAWRQFDALVGECACQLRAAKIHDLAELQLCSQEGQSVKWQTEVNNTLNQATTILQRLPQLRKTIDKSIASGQAFKAAYGTGILPSTFCRQWEILQQLSENVRFVVASYLLTQTKKLVHNPQCFYKLSDVTKPELLDRFNISLDASASGAQLTAKKIKDLTAVIQCDLSQMSIKYLQQEARMLVSTPENQLARQILESENEIRKDKMQRLCAPCFYSLETLIQRLIDKNQQLLMDVMRWTPNGKQVDRLKLLYAPDLATRTFKRIPTPVDDMPRPEPVLVITGNSIREDQDQVTPQDYIRMFDAYPLEEIIHMNAAKHTQYPGKMDEEKAPFPDGRRDQLATKGDASGCTAENPTLFSLYHIFCNRLDRAILDKEML